jgi:hypothetical protein
MMTQEEQDDELTDEVEEKLLGPLRSGDYVRLRSAMQFNEILMPPGSFGQVTRRLSIGSVEVVFRDDLRAGTTRSVLDVCLRRET